MNNVFDQIIFNERERLLSSDMNRQNSQAQRMFRQFLRTMFSRQTSANGLSVAQSGFIGDSFLIQATSPASLDVTVRAGMGFIDDSGGNGTDINSVVGMDDRCAYKPLYLDSAQTFTVPAPDATNPRFDIIEAKYERWLGDSSSRDIFDNGLAKYLPATVYKTLAWMLDGRVSTNGAASLNYKSGTPAGSPSAPSTTAGYVKLGEIYVPALAPSVAVLRDTRKILAPYGRAFCDLTVTIPHTAATPTIVSLAAPPGVRAFVKNTVAGAFTVFILPGAAAANPVAVGSAPLTPATQLEIDTPAASTLSGAEITSLGSTTAPTFSNGFTGADTIEVPCYAVGADGSTPIAASVTVNIRVSWDYA